MKFEKVSDTKIRVILTPEDLIKEHIDFHSFMTNSAESQDLFLNILDKAEKEIGFITQDCKIRIETLAMSGGDFIFTVTKLLPDNTSDLHIRKKVKVRRKKVSMSSNNLVYKFDCFDDFCEFSNFVSNNTIYSKLKIAKSILLYSYNNYYYLVFKNLNTNLSDIRNFFSGISEFCTYVNNSDVFMYKLQERGKIIFKNNAITKCLYYFN